MYKCPGLFYREIGDYKGNDWAATHESELAQLEANLAEHFGEEQYDEGKYDYLLENNFSFCF